MSIMENSTDRDHLVTRLKGMLEDMEIPKELAFTIIQAVHEEDPAAKEAIYHQAELGKIDDIDLTTVAIAQQQQQPAPTRLQSFRHRPVTDKERSQLLLQMQERHQVPRQSLYEEQQKKLQAIAQQQPAPTR